MLKWSPLSVVDDKSLQVRLTRISRFSAPMVFPSILLVLASGCSNQNADGDSWNDAIRLVQSGGEPPVEIIPTPTPDGEPEGESAAAPSSSRAKKDSAKKDSAGKDSTMGPIKPPVGPEIVPAPEGVPMARAMKQPAMDLGTPASTTRETPKEPVSDAAKNGLAEDDLALSGPEDYRTWPVP